jgi:hypothetical protein
VHPLRKLGIAAGGRSETVSNGTGAVDDKRPSFSSEMHVRVCSDIVTYCFAVKRLCLRYVTQCGLVRRYYLHSEHAVLIFMVVQ